jgi:hypothetical protein
MKQSLTVAFFPVVSSEGRTTGRLKFGNSPLPMAWMVREAEKSRSEKSNAVVVKTVYILAGGRI